MLIIDRNDRDVEVGSGWTNRLFSVPVTGGTLKELPLEYDETCERSGIYAFESPMRVQITNAVMLYVQRCTLVRDGVPGTGHTLKLRRFDVNGDGAVPSGEGGLIDRWLPRSFDSEKSGMAIDLAGRRAWVPLERASNELELLNLEEAGPVEPTVMPFTQVWGLAASPSATRLAYIARGGEANPIGLGKATIYVAPFDDPANGEPLVEAEGVLGLGWSYDGRWIAYATVDGKRGLWVVNVETKETILVQDGGSFHPHASSWSPTDYRIALIDKVDTEQKPIRIFDLREILRGK